jgi:ATP-dependent RNA helicase RhlE
MDILQLETRSWKGNDPVSPMSTPNNNYGGNRNGFRSRNGGGGFSGGRNSNGRGHGNSRPNSRPGSSRSGPARRGQ